MTIRTATGETFVVRAEADEHGILWLIDAEGMRYQLAVVLQGGWRIVDSTPDDRALLEAHGSAAGGFNERQEAAGKRVLRRSAPCHWVGVPFQAF
jgi:hypothetical protein